MAVRDPAALMVVFFFVNIGFGLIGLVEPLVLDAFVGLVSRATVKSREYAT
jgi:hypothetical protein